MFTEMVAFYLMKRYHNNLVIYNLFGLFDFFILLYFFKINKVIRFSNQDVFYGILAAAGLLWVSDNLLLNRLYEKNYIFLIVYSLFIVLLSIRLFNTMLFSKGNGLISIPFFLINISLLLFYVFTCFISLFNSPLSTISPKLQIGIWLIMSSILLIKYVLLSLAFLWIRKK
jgi:hypothetical protein